LSEKPAFAGFFVLDSKMKNIIKIYVEFDFKGRSFRPTATIDLDMQMERHGEIPAFHSLLARENGIDLYSYELEVMETAPVMVSHAEGMAEKFVQQNKQFDLNGFKEEWQNCKVHQRIEAITQQHSSVEETLFAVYQLGREDGRQEMEHTQGNDI